MSRRLLERATVARLLEQVPSAGTELIPSVSRVGALARITVALPHGSSSSSCLTPLHLTNAPTIIH
jgi:hypothetical protein